MVFSSGAGGPVGRRTPDEAKYGKESENEPHGHSPRPILM